MNNYEQVTQEVHDAFDALCKGRVEAAVKAEREACAKLVDHILKEGGGTWGDAIRARSQS